jgi:sterol desaturase/sphingolipid hydroxylase (fatty acid hydroxylase superfamily)
MQHAFVKIQLVTNLSPSNWPGLRPFKKTKLMSSVYIILTSLIYLTNSVFKSTLVKCRLTFYRNNRFKKVLLVQKAPMAHRRWSQEQYTSRQSTVILLVKVRLSDPLTTSDFGDMYLAPTYNQVTPGLFPYKARPFLSFSNDLNIISLVKYRLPIPIIMS